MVYLTLNKQCRTSKIHLKYWKSNIQPVVTPPCKHGKNSSFKKQFSIVFNGQYFVEILLLKSWHLSTYTVL